jgi:hypothetical protein
MPRLISPGKEKPEKLGGHGAAHNTPRITINDW